MFQMHKAVQQNNSKDSYMNNGIAMEFWSYISQKFKHPFYNIPIIKEISNISKICCNLGYLNNIILP